MRGGIQAILPILVGEVDEVSGEYGDFFRNGGLPDCSHEISVHAVDAKAREHLERGPP